MIDEKRLEELISKAWSLSVEAEELAEELSALRPRKPAEPSPLLDALATKLADDLEHDLKFQQFATGSKPIAPER